MIALEVEARDVDLVVDEALQHLAPDLVRLLHVRRRRELLAKVVELALRVDDGRLILLVGRRQQPHVLGHVLEVALADPERHVAVLDLLVGRVQAREALVGVDRLGVVAARELCVRDGELSQHRELRERVLLLDELEVLLCLRIVFVLQFGETFLVILLGRERVGDGF